MARKTDGEFVQELVILTARLEERVDAAREEIKALRDQRDELVQGISSHQADLSRIDSQVGDLRTKLADRATRTWSLGVAVFAAVLAATLSYVVQRFLLGK